MNRAQWAKPVSPDEASRRAAGRAKYNKWQKDEALRSRLEVARMLCELGDSRGVQSRIAVKLYVHRSTGTRYIAELRRSGWDAMGLDERRKWIEQTWAKRNDERAREHSRWVKNGGPQAAKIRQQLCMEGLIQRRQPPVEPVQAPVYRAHFDEYHRFRNNLPSDAPLSAPVRTDCSGRSHDRLPDTLEDRQRKANNYVAQNIEFRIKRLLGPTVDG